MTPASPTSSSTPKASESAPPPTPVGAIVGGVIGGVAALAAIAGVAWLVYRRRKAAEAREAHRGADAPEILDQSMHGIITTHPSELLTPPSELSSGPKSLQQELCSHHGSNELSPDRTAAVELEGSNKY